MVKKNRNILRNKGKGIKLNQLLKLYKQCKHKHCPILMLHKKQHSSMNECSIFNSSETVEYTYPQKNDVLKKPDASDIRLIALHFTPLSRHEKNIFS